MPGFGTRAIGTMAIVIGFLLLLTGCGPEGAYNNSMVIPGLAFIGGGQLLRIEGVVRSLRGD